MKAVEDWATTEPATQPLVTPADPHESLQNQELTTEGFIKHAYIRQRQQLNLKIKKKFSEDAGYSGAPDPDDKKEKYENNKIKMINQLS